MIILTHLHEHVLGFFHLGFFLPLSGRAIAVSINDLSSFFLRNYIILIHFVI